jgi:hypothetical protein
VPGVVSENLFAKSYATISSTALHKNMGRGADLNPRRRYCSQSNQEYSPNNFRRLMDRPNMVQPKDFDDYTAFVNENMTSKRHKMLETAKSMDNLAQIRVQTATDCYSPSNFRQGRNSGMKRSESQSEF